MADKDFVIKHGLVVGDTATINGVQIDPSGAISGEVLKFDGTKFAPATASDSPVSVSYEETIGNNSSTSFTVTHNLGTKDLNVIVRENTSPYEVVDVRWEATSTTSVTLDFSSAPNTDSKRVIIKGPGDKDFYSTTIGDGSNLTIVVTHNLGSKNIVPVVRNASSPYEVVEVLAQATTVDSVTLDFSSAPSSSSLVASVYLLDVDNSATFTVGDGSSQEFTLTHNLNTRDIGATCRLISSPYDFVSIRWEATTLNTAKIIFSSPPAANSRRVGIYKSLGGNKDFNSEFNLVDSDIVPSIDNVYSLGTSALRWKSISIGGGTLYITDSVTANTAAVTVANGVFNIDGIVQAQLANVKVTNLIFNDNTVQTTAYKGTSAFGGYYGSFYHTATVLLNSASTAFALPLNTTAEANGVSIVSSSRITVANAGVYNIQFSAQMDKTDSANDNVDIWLSKNGTNVADSNTQFWVEGNNGKHLASWNFVLTLAANDYVQLMANSPDVNMRIVSLGTQSNPARPAVPSLIVTVTQVR